MTDILTWDGGPTPTSESWVIENADRSGGPSLTGSEQIVSAVSSRWKAKLTFMLVREEVLWLRATLAGLDGRAGAVLIGPFDLIGAPRAGAEEPWAIDLGLPGGAQNDAPITAPVLGAFAAAAQLMDRSVSIAMAPGRKPQRGNYFSVANRLHVVTSVSGAGPFLCGIRPGLRDDVPATTVLTFSEPVTSMRLSGSSPDLPVTGGDHVTNVTLELVERF